MAKSKPKIQPELYQHTPDEIRVRRAMGEMPGGANQVIASRAGKVGFDSDRRSRPITADVIADYLEVLVGFYSTVMTDAQTQHQELVALQHDVACVRRLFGTNGGDE